MKRKKMRWIMLFTAGLCVTVVQADTMLPNQSNFTPNNYDGYGWTVILTGQHFDAGLTVTEWSGRVGTGSTCTWTPLLLDDNGNGSFTLRAVGTSQAMTDTLQTFDFGLLRGDATTTAQTTIGLFFGTASEPVGENTIQWNNPGGTTGIQYQLNTGPTWKFQNTTGDGLKWDVGTRYATTGSTSTRGYAVEFTTVPEPATLGLLVSGGVAMLLRRRKRNR